MRNFTLRWSVSTWLIFFFMAPSGEAQVFLWILGCGKNVHYKAHTVACCWLSYSSYNVKHARLKKLYPDISPQVFIK
uniref:Secreted protein n=1 Tax=Megaselia scalaris TaxID=36166 RepID=T1GVB3_MEGSC